MNAEKPRAKRHHTVPQFYLQGFANSGQVMTVELPGERRFLQSVRRAASETDFYTVKGHVDGDDAVEATLSAIEGEAAQVFAAVHSGVWPLPPAERRALGAFIALQTARGPDQRRNSEFIAAQAARLEIGFGGKAGVKGWVKSRHGVDISDEEAETLWRQATGPEGPPIRYSNAAHIQQMANLADSLTKYIIGRPWSLVRFERRSLITSDNPIGLVRHADDEESWMGVGFMTAWGITYPLSRKLGLLMSDPMVTADLVPVERVWAGALDTVQTETTVLEKGA